MTVPTSSTVSPAKRKQILRVIVISLLLDLISFTFILPLFPKLLEFYRNSEASWTTGINTNSPTLLSQVFSVLNSYKSSFSRPISSRYDIVLLGGAMGSLFSLCQAIASPIIGKLSDKYGRRTALLWSMMGNIASVALWLGAVDFRTFVASRIVGGLSEGNVQLATAMAADISTDAQRGSTMALVGACFSIAFTFGPALGAWLAGLATVKQNPFAVAAGFSLFLIVTETVYLYLYLPETLPTAQKDANTNGHVKEKSSPVKPTSRTNSHFLLNMTHFTFILFFSGLEFSLPFMTYDLFSYTAAQSGRLLGFMGLIASILQGAVTRRLHPLLVVRLGIVACIAAFFALSRLSSERALYGAASALAITTGTVVSGLGALSSFEAGISERGEKLGNFRSWGQVGRATGPVLFCTLYWWAGRETAYTAGGVGMIGVAAIVFSLLEAPPQSLTAKKGTRTEEKKSIQN